MKNKYMVVTTKSWNIDKFRDIRKQDKKNSWYFITDKNKLTYSNLKKIDPKYVFFPHWSWIIPKKIYENFDCIVFHMTDLPFGRGGSPLQNLIVRSIYKTKLSALKVVKGIDAGPIYMQKPLSLEGRAEDIYKRASNMSFKMIKEIIRKNPIPKKQKGKIVKFQRRKPSQGNMKNLKTLKEVYDYIRMLDAEGYPPAYLETKNTRLEFKDASLKKNCVEAKIEIKQK